MRIIIKILMVQLFAVVALAGGVDGDGERMWKIDDPFHPPQITVYDKENKPVVIAMRAGNPYTKVCHILTERRWGRRDKYEKVEVLWQNLNYHYDLGHHFMRVFGETVQIYKSDDCEAEPSYHISVAELSQQLDNIGLMILERYRLLISQYEVAMIEDRPKRFSSLQKVGKISRLLRESVFTDLSEKYSVTNLKYFQKMSWIIPTQFNFLVAQIDGSKIDAFEQMGDWSFAAKQFFEADKMKDLHRLAGRYRKGSTEWTHYRDQIATIYKKHNYCFLSFVDDDFDKNYGYLQYAYDIENCD